MRHLIAATLQRWVVSASPICPLQQMLRAGTRAEETHSIDELADEAAGSSAAHHVRGWHRPTALSAALALLGDICPPPWPSNEAVQRMRNIDVRPRHHSCIAHHCGGCSRALALNCCPRQAFTLYSLWLPGRFCPGCSSNAVLAGVWLLCCVL